MHQPKIILLCAYRRTGKDTLLKLISSDIKNFDNLFHWDVYKSPSSTQNIPLHFPFQHISFAARLKDEASSHYGIPPVIPDDQKDIKQFTHYKTGEIVSARDIYIEWAKIKRLEDPDYWCKLSVTDINNSHDDYIIITDWRYINELSFISNLYSDILTIRLYRSDVPMPPLDVESEHNLDNYSTDLLLLKTNTQGEYEKALERYPQYKGYVYATTL